MRKAITLLCVASATVLLAGIQSKPQLSDKNQRFSLWFTDASTEFPDKETIVFEASGNPAHGYSRDQNLEFSSSNMEGTIRKTKEGAMLLQKGTMTGSAVLTVTDKDGTSRFTTAKVTLDDNSETASVVVPGAFTYTNNHTGDDGQRELTLTGTKGHFLLKSLVKKDENPLVSATVTGPVRVTVNQVGSKGKTVVYTMSGATMTMRAEGIDKIVTISGGVHLTSEESGDAEHKGFMGTMDVSSATVTLDKDYLIKKISTKGSPGSGSVKDKEGG